MQTFFQKYDLNVWLMPLFYLALLFTGAISSTDVVILYALETIIIGIFHLFKLLVLSLSEGLRKEKLLGIFYMGFFAFHYGIFVFVQTTFFFVFLSMEDPRIKADIGLENFYTILHFQGVQSGLLFLMISYLIKFWFGFYRSQYYKTIDIRSYFFQPYLRIFIQQFVAIIPGFFIIFGKAGFVAAILLIIIRSITDYYLDKMRTDPLYFEKGFNFLFKKKIQEGMSSEDRSEAEDLLKIFLKG